MLEKGENEKREAEHTTGEWGNVVGTRNPLTGTELFKPIATPNRYKEPINTDDDDDHDHANDHACTIPSTSNNEAELQSGSHNLKGHKLDKRQRQRRKEMLQHATTVPTTHNTTTQRPPRPRQSPYHNHYDQQLDADDEEIRDAAAANQLRDENWVKFGSQQLDNHDHTTTTCTPQQNQRTVKRTRFAQQPQRVHYCTHDITAHDHNEHNADGSRDPSAHCSSAVACSVNCHPHSSTRGCNWSTSSGLFAGAVPHFAPCLREQASVGEDGREVMSPANAPPLAKLGLVPRPPVLTTEAGVITACKSTSGLHLTPRT